MKFVALFLSQFFLLPITEAAVECRMVEERGSPQATPLAFAPEFQKWCQTELVVGNETAKLIFLGDSPRAETSLLVKRSGLAMTASLREGKRERHAISPELFAAPEINLWQTRALVSGDLHAKAEAIARYLQEPVAGTFAWDKVDVGTFRGNAAALPFSGHWWPFAHSPLAAGPFSPLGKFDEFVKARTGTNPDSVAWEKRHHSLTNIPWAGHCNGWAASSLLYPEQNQVRWDEKSRRLFYPSDLKGVLAEASFCLSYAFFGRRFYGAGDDPKDISPDLFHKVLAYYIGEQKKAVVVDYKAAEDVDNHVVSAYTFQISRAAAPFQFRVDANLTLHSYDSDRRDHAGPAPAYSQVYSYLLRTDETGKILGGEWISNNPDFLWVPLSPRACPGENANLPEEFIGELLALPAATRQSREMNFSLVKSWEGGESLIPDPEFPAGAEYELLVDWTGADSLLLEADLYPRHPYYEGGPETVRFYVYPGRRILRFNGQQLANLRLQNPHQRVIAGKLQFLTLTYVGERQVP